jgi:hypothetical protein
LFYALYKLLPNDTDFSVFRPYGIPGLNFAFGENLQAYHSRLDTTENLSAESLQHHGSYALSLVRSFGQTDLSQLKLHSGDAIFFNWLGRNLIVYPQSWAISGEILATILLALAFLFGVRRAEIRVARVLQALMPAVAILILVPVVVSASGWLLLRVLGSHMLIGDAPANSWLLIGLVLLGACTGGVLLAAIRKKFFIQEIFYAGLLLICILSWVITLMLPAGSYVVFWPLLFAAIGLLTIELLSKGAQAKALWLASLGGTLAAILLFAPLAQLLYVFLTLQLITIAAVGLLIGLFFLISMPALNIAFSERYWGITVLALLLGAIGSLITGTIQSHSSIEHPRLNSIAYSLNADRRTSVWFSYDQSLDHWTSQFIPVVHRQPLPEYLAGFERPVLSGPGPLLDLQAPIANISTNEIVNNRRHIRMNVRSPRNAGRIFLRFDKDVLPATIKVAGREPAYAQNQEGLNITIVGPFPDGIDIDLTFKTQSEIGFWLMDQSYGLPDTGASPRPQDLIAADGSDLSLICRRYKL